MVRHLMGVQEVLTVVVEAALYMNILLVKKAEPVVTGQFKYFGLAEHSHQV
jgi:hypothetical protein